MWLTLSQFSNFGPQGICTPVLNIQENEHKNLKKEQNMFLTKQWKKMQHIFLWSAVPPARLHEWFHSDGRGWDAYFPHESTLCSAGDLQKWLKKLLQSWNVPQLVSEKDIFARLIARWATDAHRWDILLFISHSCCVTLLQINEDECSTTHAEARWTHEFWPKRKNI